MYELLSVEQKRRADTFAEARGVPGIVLMENAGRMCCEAIHSRCSGRRRVCVLCGPGGNGGDGFVIARLLAERGHDVRVGLLSQPEDLRGDPAIMASRWAGGTSAFSMGLLEGAEIIVDAIFGMGLARPIEGDLAALIQSINENRACRVVAVDIPTGLDGDKGAVQGVAVCADMTVTFFRKVPGHLLMPGKSHCGEVIVADIGIPTDALSSDRDPCLLFENTPPLWQDDLPVLSASDHKYSRGHAVVIGGGPTSTGAARLAARSALRAGAGAVTLVSPSSALAVNASHLTAIMLARADNAEDVSAFLRETRQSAVLLGPGNGVGEKTKTQCLAALESHSSCVLDADALTSLADDFSSFQRVLKGRSQRCVTVLTPHEGEFSRLFSGMEKLGDKVKRARDAAALSGAIVILKGSDTVVAAPDGRAVINGNAPETLATAGSGDVLAGIVCGFLAQEMGGFSAACAAVWLHGATAYRLGLGLISEDLPEEIPSALRFLLRKRAPIRRTDCEGERLAFTPVTRRKQRGQVAF